MAGWLDDNRKNGDMMFAVRAGFIRRDGKPETYSGTMGPYLSLKGARNKATSIEIQYRRMQDQDWFTSTYKGWYVKIEATLLDWQVVEQVSLDFDD